MSEDFEWFSGSCLEFALALADTFERHGEVVTLLIGHRTEWDLTGVDPLPLFSFSHAVVIARDTTWDAQGATAIEHWEARWANEEAEFGTTSEFEWISVTGPNRWESSRHLVENLGGAKPRWEAYQRALDHIQTHRVQFFPDTGQPLHREPCRLPDGPD